MATIINRRPSALAAAALEVARTQLGVKESPLGSNDGPQVREYLNSVGLDPGFSWDAAFVYWCFRQGTIYASPLPRSGGVMNMFMNAKGKYIKVLDSQDAPITADDLRPGDIFILQFASGHGHAGIVDKISGDTIITIEGNTDPAGGRKEIGVYSKRRKITLLRGIIRVGE